ncbi:hypothetical protein C8J57DRAFT_1225663 [Mycena rebaudengoi]|nr:hypothetical protein C8J57DRAFT_1225663 [Mycena rebaudengoi]
MVQAKAGPRRARAKCFGLACNFTRPKPHKARPKPWLSGQAKARTSLPVGDALRVYGPEMSQGGSQQESVWIDGPLTYQCDSVRVSAIIPLEFAGLAARRIPTVSPSTSEHPAIGAETSQEVLLEGLHCSINTYRVLSQCWLKHSFKASLQLLPVLYK